MTTTEANTLYSFIDTAWLAITHILKETLESTHSLTPQYTAVRQHTALGIIYDS